MKKVLFSSLVAISVLSTSILAKEYNLDNVHTDVGFKI